MEYIELFSAFNEKSLILEIFNWVVISPRRDTSARGRTTGLGFSLGGKISCNRQKKFQPGWKNHVHDMCMQKCNFPDKNINKKKIDVHVSDFFISFRTIM